jgi:hypothetical protein
VSAEPAIEVVDLVKRYPKSPVNAVDGVSFRGGPRARRARRSGLRPAARHARAAAADQPAFSLVFTPLLFTGCSQYPWPSLDRLRWFQVVTAANPMTYVSESLRGALVPGVPHIPPWICLVVLLFAVVVLLVVGVRGFYRRAID